ncbi:MAG: glycosyltransferase [Bacteroidales bacterium]|nr:glycosyltransferase [Bacteroidales bacterium]
MSSEPLVSVPVITYNSSKFVLETLESIKAQTYQNIELIISDDCSTDNTVEVCKNWIEENKSRFVRTLLIESPVNTGVSANMNRAEDACRGEWVKPIAGDDLLLSECVESYMRYVTDHPKAKVLFGRIRAFGASDDVNERFNKTVFDYDYLNRPRQEQLSRLLFRGNYIPAASYFFNLPYLRSLGIQNDERIPLLEDWPKWINILKKGIVFHLIDKEMVKYRISENSLSTSSKPSLAFRKSNALFYRYYQFWPLIKEGHVSYAIIMRMDAEKMIGGTNIFWGGLYGLYLLYRRLKHVEEPAPVYF